MDLRDIYIGYNGHPKFVINRIIEDDLIRVVIQKYEMIIFTNKGDVLGDVNLGCDLIKYLHETKISAEGIKKVINLQISEYIPELYAIDYTIDVWFEQDPDRFSDIMFIGLEFAGYDVKSIII